MFDALLLRREEMLLNDETLSLRPWLPGDAPALEPACRDPEITRHTTVPVAYNVPAAQAWIASQRERTGEGNARILAVVPAGMTHPVGMAGLFGLNEADGPRLGYWITREHRGRGLATKAAALLAAWAAGQGHRGGVTLEAEPDNAASQAVARRLGAIPRDRHTVQLDGLSVVLDRFLVLPRLPLSRRRKQRLRKPS